MQYSTLCASLGLTKLLIRPFGTWAYCPPLALISAPVTNAPNIVPPSPSCTGLAHAAATSGVGVRVGVIVAVGVTVGVGVMVGVGESVGVGVIVVVSVAVGVAVAVGVIVGVGESVGVEVLVAV